MSDSADTYDALIVGAGPAGASAAIHLATRGARVLLAEQKKFPRAKLCGEFISPECLTHFERLGVADEMMSAGGASLMETVFYSRRGAGVHWPSEWFMAGGVALGLSRAEMDARLLARAREAGAEVLEEAQGAGLLMNDGSVRGVRLKTDEGVREINAAVTIDATGRSRALARRVEADGRAVEVAMKKRRTKLVAFKAHLEGASGAAGCCEIYFYRGGYGGLSRIEGGLSNLCFIAAAGDVRACGGNPERVMREIIATNRRAAETLKGARVQSEWLAVSLDGFGRHQLIPAAGLLAIGDAASFIDPFTGSGMLMALESGELAAEVIDAHLPRLRLNKPDGAASLAALADDYRARYQERFNARLRVCSLLRRAAFVPRLTEMGMVALKASRRVRYRLARSTRRTSAR